MTLACVNITFNRGNELSYSCAQYIPNTNDTNTKNMRV